mgnify:CR=1 FL=1
MPDDTHTAAELMQWLVDKHSFGIDVTMAMPEWIFDLCAQTWMTNEDEPGLTLEDWQQLLRDEGCTVEGK